MNNPVDKPQNAFNTAGPSRSFSPTELAHARRKLAAVSALGHMSAATGDAFCTPLPTVADKYKTAKIRGRL